MIRSISAVVVALLAWGIVATVLDMLLRVTMPGYAVAEPQMQFTLGMMLARLAVPGALPTAVAGFLGGWIGRGNHWVTATIMIVLLAVFLPTHYRLWDVFPAWYHATFIGSLILLPWVGALASRPLRASDP